MFVISPFSSGLSLLTIFCQVPGKRQNGNCPRAAQPEFCHFAEAPRTCKKWSRSDTRKRGDNKIKGDAKAL